MFFVTMPPSQAMLTVRSIFLLINIVLITSNTIINAVNTAPTSTRPERLVAKLIHRDSIYAQSGKDFVSDDIMADLLPRTSMWNMFFVNFSIGKPPVPQLAVMDTGSDLLWVNCFSTEWHKDFPDGEGFFYFPKESATYSIMSCRKHFCEPNCNDLDECHYKSAYISGVPSSGIYAFEQLTFETSDGSEVRVPDVKFGCNHMQWVGDKGFSGVFGLGSGSSLVKQLGSKFSYCVGSITDPYYNYNKLFLGGGAVMEGYSTPFRKWKEAFYVTLEGISLGGEMIDIDQGFFKEKPKTEEGVIIDSGTGYTWLADGPYTALKAEVEVVIGELLPRYYNDSHELWKDWLLCYEGNVDKDLGGVLPVTFHLAEGADLVLEAGSLFHQRFPDAYCMAVGPHSYKGNYGNLTAIGMFAQQNYNVGYDLNENELYFQRIDCELLED